jgi:hypothetical protein
MSLNQLASKKFVEREVVERDKAVPGCFGSSVSNNRSRTAGAGMLSLDQSKIHGEEQIRAVYLLLRHPTQARWE